MDALIIVMPEAHKPGSNEGRLWLGLEAKNLPCEVFAGLVNAPFADSFAPQPSTFNPRHVQQIPAFLAAWIPFLSPCTVVAPISLVFSLYFHLQQTAPACSSTACTGCALLSSLCFGRICLAPCDLLALGASAFQLRPPSTTTAAPLGVPALVPVPLRLPNRSPPARGVARLPVPLQQATTLDLSSASSQRRIFSLSLVPTSFSSAIISTSNLSFSTRFPTLSCYFLIRHTLSLTIFFFFCLVVSTLHNSPTLHMLDAAQ